jgi:hypothetical protein
MKTGLRVVAGLLFLIAAGIISLGVFLSKGKGFEPWHFPSLFAEPDCPVNAEDIQTG